MADTPFNGFAAQSVIAWNDKLIGQTAAGGGVNYPGNAFQPRDVSGCTFGGFGAVGSVYGVIDWNDVSNARSGSGATLLQGSSPNGPAAAYGNYFHPFNFETSPRDGSGNITQLAIPYANASINLGIWMRGKYQGVWGGWYQVLSENGSNAFAPATDNAKSLGAASRRYSVVYAGTGSINTSDEREKQQIGDIPDVWLDAWGDVAWCRFRFNDAVADKGADNARWHTGLIAQAVRDAFAARGIDAAEIGLIGLLCHDEWGGTPAEPQVVDEAGNEVTPAQPAGEGGDRYGLRYEECFAVEAAYQRRRMAAIEARLAALEAAA